MPELSRERRKGELETSDQVRLLVVEDDPNFRVMVCRALEGAAYAGRPITTQEAPSVEAALRVVLGGGCDLIILDLGFRQGLQGSDLLKRMREAGVQVPILVVTGDSLYVDSTELYRLGAADILVKPPSIYALKDAVNGILRAAEAARRPAWTSPCTSSPRSEREAASRASSTTS